MCDVAISLARAVPDLGPPDAEAPHDSGKKSLVEKAGQKRKVAENKAPSEV